MTTLLTEEWEEYRRSRIAAGADPAAVAESRPVFFAGALVVMMILGALGEEDTISVAEGERVLENLLEEIAHFAECAEGDPQ